jgi:hypothetical protein
MSSAARTSSGVRGTNTPTGICWYIEASVA